MASETAVVGGVAIEFVAGDSGIVDWALTDVKSAGIDGLATRLGALRAEEGPLHGNGVTQIDHLVVATPQLDRTIDALEDEGIELRRIREGETGMGKYRQAFFRVGQPILEVVESAELGADAPARFWGITFTTADIDAAAELLDDKLARVKDAVQPGRRIATLRR